MKMKSNISVAMTTYNGERFLEAQIDSILSQTLPPDEIIVCDDISNDRTLAILNKYQKKSFLQYHINKRRLGVIENFKKAVSLTKPRNYIALSDQDDIWLPEKLDIQCEKLCKIDDTVTPALVYSDLHLIDENNGLINESFWNELGTDVYNHSFKTLLFGNYILGCTSMFNSAMKPFFTDIPNQLALNHDAWTGLIAYSFGKVSEIGIPLVKYRKHAANVTTLSGYTKPSRMDRLKKHMQYVFRDTDFLKEQFELSEYFIDAYNEKLSPEQEKLIQQFLTLKNTKYIQKKLVQRKFFKGEWK